MRFQQPTHQCKILKRYKRFLADIELKTKEVVVAHTPNTGSMKECWAPNWKALVTESNNPKRKLKYTLEMTHNGRSWIGVNTSLTNKLAIEAIEKGVIEELQGYPELKPEKKVGKSRIDIFLSGNDRDCYVEVKNVTLNENQKALFPDAVSTRGLKHLHELTELKKQGNRCCMLYIVQREDVDSFSVAKEIDSAYDEGLKLALEAGVEVLVYGCSLSPKEIKVTHSLPFIP